MYTQRARHPIRISSAASPRTSRSTSGTIQCYACGTMSAAKSRGSSGSISVNCKMCHAAIWTFPSLARRKKFCGRACYATWLSKERSGAAHPNFGRRHSAESLALMRKTKAANAVTGPQHHGWKGGRYLTRGYLIVTMSAAEMETFGSMAKAGGYVPQHRLVMARKLKRPLLRSEVVHHRNGIKTDNRLRNLELSDHATHKRDHQAIVKELRWARAEIERLRSRLASLRSRAGG